MKRIIAFMLIFSMYLALGPPVGATPTAVNEEKTTISQLIPIQAPCLQVEAMYMIQAPEPFIDKMIPNIGRECTMEKAFTIKSDEARQTTCVRKYLICASESMSSDPKNVPIGPEASCSFKCNPLTY